MTFEELQRATLRRTGDRLHEVLGTGTDIADGETTVATYAGLKEEINIAYRDAVNELDQQHKYYQHNVDDVTFNSGTQELDLSASGVLTATPRKILWISFYPDNNTSKEPLRVIMPHRGNRRWTRGSYAGSAWWPSYLGNNRPVLDLTGYKLAFTETPTRTWILQIGSVPVLADMVNNSDEPDNIPPMHQHYIATKASITLLGGEDGAPQWMITLEKDQRYKLENDTGLNEFSPRVPGAWRRRSRR